MEPVFVDAEILFAIVSGRDNGEKRWGRDPTHNILLQDITTSFSVSGI